MQLDRARDALPGLGLVQLVGALHLQLVELLDREVERGQQQLHAAHEDLLVESLAVEDLQLDHPAGPVLQQRLDHHLVVSVRQRTRRRDLLALDGGPEDGLGEGQGQEERGVPLRIQRHRGEVAGDLRRFLHSRGIRVGTGRRGLRRGVRGGVGGGGPCRSGREEECDLEAGLPVGHWIALLRSSLDDRGG